ncbi:MAG TPA: YsnF/AvaK domain-containing protein [Burkholderiales bacterium]
MAKTVVGLMQSSAEAERVVRDLTSTCNCSREAIGLMARGTEKEDHHEVAHGAAKGAVGGAAIGGVLGLVAGVASLSIPGFGPFIAAGPIASALAGAGIGAAAGGIIGALANLGVPEDEAHYYAEGVRRGGTLITVRADTDQVADCAAGVMRQHGAVDIEARAAQWKQAGWSGRLEAGGNQTIPVVEEELAVGKRQVGKGGVRVYSEVTEVPVQETVQLREERANVQRRKVNRPATPADEGFEQRAIEIEETAEEPVVGKRRRVTEEVTVGKEARERQETVSDSVRKTDVRVEHTASGSGSWKGDDRRKNKAPYTGQDRRASFR